MITAQTLFGILPRAMLRCASVLVPEDRRAAWLQEWNSELWYVSRANEAEPDSLYEKERRAAEFCLGAFQDAWILRREREPSSRLVIRPSRSAVRCAATLFLLVAVSFTCSLLLPNVRATMRPLSYQDSRHLVLISPSGTSVREEPSMPMRQMRLWQGRAQHVFSEFAFYQPVTKPIRIATTYTPELRIARATANLFSLLGVHAAYATGRDETMPTLLVSEAVWRQQFHGDLRLLGSTVEVGLRKARLGGVITKEQWRLPGAFDAWLLEPESSAAAISSSARGFVIGHLIPSDPNSGFGEEWRMYAPQPDGRLGSFECATLSSVDHVPAGIYIFTVLLALLALPATTSLPLGEYPVQRNRISSSLRLRRWMFLGAKFVLLLPLIYCGSLDLAYAFVVAPATAQYIQIVTSFLIGLFGFRWILKDQRKRCPVCLCTLSNPARVGEPSRSFLGWDGTELICSEGHGLLHVPELPTSWFATQRWLYLDPSWNSVFLRSF